MNHSEMKKFLLLYHKDLFTHKDINTHIKGLV